MDSLCAIDLHGSGMIDISHDFLNVEWTEWRKQYNHDPLL